MSYKIILLSKLLETDLLFNNMGPVAQRLEQGTHIPLVESSILSGPTKEFTCHESCSQAMGGIKL